MSGLPWASTRARRAKADEDPSISSNRASSALPEISVTDSVSPTGDLQIPFNDTFTGTSSDETVTVINSGNANLLVGTVADNNPLNSPFTIVADGCSGSSLPPAGSWRRIFTKPSWIEL